MSRNKYFKAWLVDALADMVRLQEELVDAKCNLQAARWIYADEGQRTWDEV